MVGDATSPYDALAGLILDKDPPASGPDLFEGDEAKVMAGLAVYRNNVRASLSRVLGDTFPVLKTLVGEDFFKFVAHEYFHAHPPRHPNVVRYGEALPEFIASMPQAADYPYLGDVARLELAWLAAYHAADAAPMTPADIAAGVGEDIAAARFALHPSLRLLASPYPVVSIWNRHKHAATDQSTPLPKGGEHALITRPHRDVNIRVLTRGSYAAVEALHTGHALEGAIEAAVGTEPDFDPNGFFQDLFTYQIITGIH